MTFNGVRRVRRPAVVIAFVAALVLLAARPGSPPLEQMFVAQTQAAAENADICLAAEHEGQQAGQDAAATQAAKLANTVDTSTDLPPVRMVVDPYPSFNGVVVDTANDRVMMSDTNRKSLLLYARTAGSAASRAADAPLQQIMGPETGVGFVAGVAMDPAHRELFTVNNDVEDRLVVFDYDARGNVKPKRLLYVPHQSWGIAFDHQARRDRAVGADAEHVRRLQARRAEVRRAGPLGPRPAHRHGRSARHLLRRDAQRGGRRQPRQLPARPS